MFRLAWVHNPPQMQEGRDGAACPVRPWVVADGESLHPFVFGVKRSLEILQLRLWLGVLDVSFRPFQTFSG